MASGFVGFRAPALIVMLAAAAALGAVDSARAEEQSAAGGAAPASPEDSGGLQEIVVTARYRAESLQKTPIAITALTGAELAARGVTNVTDLTASIPNTSLVKLGSTGGSALVAYVRGLGQASHSLAFQPGVPIYVDDIYQPTAFGSLLTLGDVERVDVLRGPQGTLFGKNSEGGAVTIRSVDPKGDDSGYVQGGAGSYSDRRFRGAFDTSLIKDKLFLRVAAGNERSDGYVTRFDYACAHPADAGNIRPSSTSNCKIGTSGGLDETYARVALKWLPTDSVIARLSVNTTQDNDEAVPEVPLRIDPTYPGSDLALFNSKVAVPLFGIPVSSKFINSNPYANYATFYNPAQGLTFSPNSPQRSWDVTGKLDWNLGAVQFTSISGYRNFHGTIPEYKNGPIPINMVRNNINYESYSEEDRLSGMLFGDKLEWTGGLYYFRGSGTQLGDINLAASQVGPFFGVNETLVSPTTDENQSAYVHFVYHFTDKLSLEAGARYSHDRFQYTYGGTNLANIPVNPLKQPGTPVFGPNTLHVDSTSSRVDPKVAVQYQWTPQFMTYAQYSTGFKGGGTNPTPINAAQATPFTVESLKAYEIGAKSDFFDRHLTINVDGYYNDVTGLQLVGFATSSIGGTVTLNAGHAIIKGAELEIDARPFGGLLLNASAGYLDFKYHGLDAAAFSAQNPGGLRPSDVAPYSPTFKGNVGIQYAIGLAAAGTLTPRVDATYTSRVYFDPQNLLASSQGGYAMVNGHLTWLDPAGKLSATVDVNNVTNKLYYLSMFNQLKSYGILTGQPGEPRNVMVTLKYMF